MKKLVSLHVQIHAHPSEQIALSGFRYHEFQPSDEGDGEYEDEDEQDEESGEQRIDEEEGIG